MKKAVVLASGGIDSSTVLAIVTKMGFEIYALTFNYSQRHHIEIGKIKEFIKDGANSRIRFDIKMLK